MCQKLKPNSDGGVSSGGRSDRAYQFPRAASFTASRSGRSSTSSRRPLPQPCQVPVTRGWLTGTPGRPDSLSGTNLEIIRLNKEEMTRQFLHTLFCPILVAVVGLSCVGLTRIVGYCSMSDSAECCCGNDEDRGLLTAHGGPSVASGADSCYSVHAVGGLNDMRAVPSHENVTNQSPFQSFVVFPPSSGHDSVHHLLARNHLRSDHSPPQDSDIYTQTHSLLI